MIRLRRVLAGAAALVAVTLVAAGCDTSPYAAVINAQTLKQTGLNAELRARAANPAYIRAVDSEGQSSQFTVEGVSPGTYSTKWVAQVLGDLIGAAVIHQRLVADRGLPDASMLAASRAFDESVYGPIWLGFSPAYRDTLVTRDAEHAEVEPVNADQNALYGAYQASYKYFYTNVCTRQIGVSVPKSDGTVDYPASAALAANIQNQFNLTRRVPVLAATLGEVSGGTVICYSPAQLETQPAAFYNTVLGLGVGSAAVPTRTSFGYSVLAVVSRGQQGFSADVQRAVSLGLQQSDPALIRLVSQARVKVNPQYGKWSPGGANSLPGVIPPTLSASTT